MSKAYLLKFFLVFLLTFSLAYIVGASIPYFKIDVSDQPIGSTVFIKEVRLSKSGFLLVQSLDPETKLPDQGRFLNNPTFMPRGVYKNINLALTDLGSDIQTKVTVTLYEDNNGNGAFDGFYTTDEQTLAPEEGFDKPMFTFIGNRIVRKVIKLY